MNEQNMIAFILCAFVCVDGYRKQNIIQLYYSIFVEIARFRHGKSIQVGVLDLASIFSYLWPARLRRFWSQKFHWFDLMVLIGLSASIRSLVCSAQFYLYLGVYLLLVGLQTILWTCLWVLKCNSRNYWLVHCLPISLYKHSHISRTSIYKILRK